MGKGRVRVGTSWSGFRPRLPRPRHQHSPQLEKLEDPEVQAAREKFKYQSWLSTQPEDVKEAALEGELAEAKALVSDDELERLSEMPEEEAEREAAQEIANLKRNDPRAWVRLLASLPHEDREKMQEIARKHGV